MSVSDASDFYVMTHEEVENKPPTFYLVGFRKCDSIEAARETQSNLRPISARVFACYPVEGEG